MAGLHLEGWCRSRPPTSSTRSRRSQSPSIQRFNCTFWASPARRTYRTSQGSVLQVSTARHLSAKPSKTRRTTTTRSMAVSLPFASLRSMATPGCVGTWHAGLVDQRSARRLERDCLSGLRRYDSGDENMESVLDAICSYAELLGTKKGSERRVPEDAQSNAVEAM